MKITKNGMEFECDSIEDIELVSKYFNRSARISERTGVPTRTYDTKKEKKNHVKMHYRTWLMEEADEIVRLVKGGATFKAIKKNPLLSRHTESAIYNRFYHVRRGDKTLAGKVISAAMERAGM